MMRLVKIGTSVSFRDPGVQIQKFIARAVLMAMEESKFWVALAAARRRQN
jgi:hypothetical protein